MATRRPGGKKITTPYGSPIGLPTISLTAAHLVCYVAALVASHLAMDQMSFQSKGAPIEKPLEPSECRWKPGFSPRGSVAVLVSLMQRTIYGYRDCNPIASAALEIKAR